MSTHSTPAFFLAALFGVVTALAGVTVGYHLNQPAPMPSVYQSKSLIVRDSSLQPIAVERVDGLRKKAIQICGGPSTLHQDTDFWICVSWAENNLVNMPGR